MDKDLKDRFRTFLIWLVEDGYQINWEFEDDKITIYGDTSGRGE